jgi:hypothetical protein
VAKGEPLIRLVRWVVDAAAKIERDENPRQRARRPREQANQLSRVDTLVCNLAYAVLMPPETGRLAVRLGNLSRGISRYDNPALGPKPFRNLVGLLDSADFLDRQFPRVRRGEVSSIAPTDWFAKRVREYAVGLGDFGRHPSEEVVILTRNSRRRSGAGRETSIYRERINYKDTRETCAYRDEVRRLNTFLEEARIDFVSDGSTPPIDPFQRALTRHFTILPDQPERFNQNGRLFGGFWQTIKSERRRNIRINGEPVATLDYSSMFTRLAYARLNTRAPEGDLYEVPGTEGYRSGIKTAMNTFLFDTAPRRSWPNEVGIGVGSDMDAERDPEGIAASYKGLLPEGWTVSRTKKAILAKHPALKAAWGNALGYQLMFDESRILLTALNLLMAEGVAALGLHDGLLVQASKQSVAMKIMKNVAREITGTDIPVSIKD